MFFSVSSFSNEYARDTLDCSITGDYQTVEDAMPVSLPETISFEILATRISGKTSIIHSGITTDVIDMPKIRLKRTFRKAESSRGFEKSATFNVVFDDLDSKESLDILSKLGAIDLPKNLPKGFELGTLKINWNKANRLISQVHFPVSRFKGLSYHIDITCIHKR
jgi:hypothetical protein